jgi:protein-tyrosine phosphatase
VILTMTDAHKARIIADDPVAASKTFSLTEYVAGTHQDVLDAFGMPMDFYRTVLAQPEQLVGAALVKAATRP